MYENPWMFDGKAFLDEDIGESVGFVYLIINTVTGKRYIGRKYFYSIKKKKKSDKRRTKSDSDWKDYYSSSPELQRQVEQYGKDSFSRVIISLHKTRGDVNIGEVKEQFLRNVLENDLFLNENINGKWRAAPKHIIGARRYDRSTPITT